MLLSEICCLVSLGRPLWREDGSAICSVSLNGPSRSEHVTKLYCLIWDSPNLEGQVPVFIFPRTRVAQLYSRALGSLYVVSYDSQGYGVGILTLLYIYISFTNSMVQYKVKSQSHVIKAEFFKPIYTNSIRASQVTHYVTATELCTRISSRALERDVTSSLTLISYTK
jgi:hypothetical protein